LGYLRIILALVVAVGHLQSAIYDASSSTILFVGPMVAVKLFFVISGYYMAMVYGNYSDASGFLLSRAARLFPAYWLTIGLAVATALLLRSPRVPLFLDLSFWLECRQFLTIALHALSNLSFLGLDLGLFSCAQVVDGTLHIAMASDTVCPDGTSLMITRTVIIQPAWTLALEVYFYLLVPLFAICRTRTIFLTAVGSFLLALFIAVFHNRNPWFRSFFPAELYLFLAGFLAFRLRDYLKGRLGRGCAVVVLGIILSYQHLPFFDWFNPAGPNIALYLAFAVAIPSVFSIGKSLPFERIVGDFSYPVYISHVVVESAIYTVQLHSRWSLTLYQWIAVNVAMVMILAAILMMITFPIERIRETIKTRRMSLASKVLSPA
jgi:peptidoglycan/LPS O-acetylase OafA/YrhL